MENELNPTIVRTIDMVVKTDPALKEKLSEKFLEAKKNIDFLNGLLAYQINHDNINELTFYLGQVSNNMYLISTTKALLSQHYNLCKSYSIRYLVEINSKLLDKPRILNDMINAELCVVISAQEEIDDLEKLISKRSEYIRTLISAQKEFMRNEYQNVLQTQK